MNFISINRLSKIIFHYPLIVIVMGRNSNLFFALAVFILLHDHASLATVPNISTDEAALLALKSRITFNSNNDLLARNWSSSTPVCSWIGITCSSRHHRVAALDISSMQLHGTIPPHLGNLSFLVSMDISYNSFHGDFPNELAHLQRLKMIIINSNNFTGSIPSFLSLLPHIQIVYLGDNQFTGKISPSLSNLTEVEELTMDANFLEGEIPRELGHLRYLKFLNLEANHITGVIPPSIFNVTTMRVIALTGNNLTEKCRKLQFLSLAKNEFTGTVPRELANLTALTKLFLSRLHLKGEIPVELGNLKKLQILGLGENGFTGSIPASIFNMSAVQLLSLEDNKLSGTLPADLGRGMPSLEEFYCGINHLGGYFSSTISNSSRLKILDLSDNNFTGPISGSLGTLEYLELLNIGVNNFFSDTTVSFLTSLTRCRKLRVLAFDDNPLYGVLPTSVWNFSNSLQLFYGDGCKLNGVIPEDIDNLTGVIKMSMSNNELTGFIPKAIQGMLNLQELYLDSNKIQGPIPDVICNLKNLGALHLSENQLSGSVPPCLGNVTSLRYLYLDYNRLNSGLPVSLGGLQNLLELNVSFNLLSGRIPLEIGNLKAAILIDLERNNFSGKIPTTLEGLDKLSKLSLAYNKLDGPIPDSFGKILAMEFLDLSHNNLSGEIPKSLEALVHLTYLNVSFNKLSGAIPTGGPFENLTDKSFLFNDALCGDSKFHVSPCIIKSPKRSLRKKTIMVLCISLGVGLLFLALALTYIFFKLQKKKNKSQADVSLVKGHERLSYNELEQATEGFGESNLLGKGSFSMVYKGILKDGTLLAAKIFNVQLEGAFKSFDTECEILRNLRHRNLTKVITSCSSPDFRALVLEYMPNGTLEKWLYSHNNFLDMFQRLDIMIDVASAIDYLHNGYPTPVVHCDLKPSNVLLDQEMVGHISDFGIAKLLGAGEAFVQTRTIATIGYIAPEYGQDGIVSTSCDIYSFGILIMETFTRVRPSDEMFTDDLSMRRWISDSVPKGIDNVVDANLIHHVGEQNDTKMQCLLSIMELALSCTLETPNARISIEEALSTLKKVRLQFCQ